MRLKKHILSPGLDEASFEEKLEPHVIEALEFVSSFILSGGRHKPSDLSKKALELLKSFVTKNSYKLYRGYYLIRNRLGKDVIDKAMQLKVGDEFPDYLQGTKGLIKPYTKKKSVARSYAKEGDVNIVTEAKVNKGSIIADLESLIPFIKDIKQDIVDKDDLDYFKSDKEVLVVQPIKSKIVFIK